MSVPTLIKQPTENRLYTMEFASNMEADESITSVLSVVAVPTGLNLVGSPAFSGSRATQRISGGTNGTLYKVTFIVTTTGGNTLEGEGWLRVQDI